MELKIKVAIAALMLCGAMIGCGPSTTVTGSDADSVSAYQKAHWPNEPDERWYGDGRSREGAHQHPCRFDLEYRGDQSVRHGEICHIDLHDADFVYYEKQHNIPQHNIELVGAALYDAKEEPEITALTCEIKGKGVYDARLWLFGAHDDHDVVCK
jgi:hypothetical protein